MADASIILDRLSKRYPGTNDYSLRDVSLQVQAGEVYGFLGANGAGKSTTIRLLLNFLQPTSGSAHICGLDVVHDSVSVRRNVGYLAGDVALYPRPSGRQLLGYLAALQGGVDKDYVKKLEKRFEAELDKPLGALSKGNRQKIGILQAVMHQPKVLILDEPTSGLDPLMQEAFYETLREQKAAGAAIFMSSHNLSETQRVCDRIGIIKRGRLIREQTIRDDVALGAPVFRIVLKNPADLSQLAKAPQLKLLSQQDASAVLQATGSIKEALATLSRYDILSFATEQLNLEDEFMEYYGDGA